MKDLEKQLKSLANYLCCNEGEFITEINKLLEDTVKEVVGEDKKFSFKKHKDEDDYSIGLRHGYNQHRQECLDRFNKLIN